MFPYRKNSERMYEGGWKKGGEKRSSSRRDWRMSSGLRADYVERLPSAVGGRYLDFVAQTNESTARTASLRLMLSVNKFCGIE